MVRPWLQEESLGFANQFRELAQKLSCHLDVTTRAGGDCLPHGVVSLLELELARNPAPVASAGLEEEEEERLPLQAGSSSEGSEGS